jgi:hypothetical protein
MSDKPQVAIYDCATGEATVRDMTDEESVIHNDRLAHAEEDNAARLVAEAQERADAATGRQKLLDLGLSEDEVTALVGPAPIEPEPAPAV